LPDGLRILKAGIVVAAIGAGLWGSAAAGREPAGGPSGCADPPRPVRVLEGLVIAITDGDTVRVWLFADGVERVRMLGIDAPEEWPSDKLDRDAARSGQSRETIQALGRLAAAFTRRHLAGRIVGLDLDVQPRDRYGRLLAYLWTPDGVLFNRLIVAEGYAQTLTVPPNVRYADLLRVCEQEARAGRRGLWAP
jgi:micrococcal nuclease